MIKKWGLVKALPRLLSQHTAFLLPKVDSVLPSGFRDDPTRGLRVLELTGVVGVCVWGGGVGGGGAASTQRPEAGGERVNGSLLYYFFPALAVTALSGLRGIRGMCVVGALWWKGAEARETLDPLKGLKGRP